MVVTDAATSAHKSYRLSPLPWTKAARDASAGAHKLTRIIVAHRPDTIAGAQRVLGLQRGTVLAVEQGTEGAPNDLQI